MAFYVPSGSLFPYSLGLPEDLSIQLLFRTYNDYDFSNFAYISMTNIKSGYIYVLTHPSDPDLFKIGITHRDPKVRLAQHNSDISQLTGRIVKETNCKWVLKDYYPVEDPYWAEVAFWSATPFADMPFLKGVEVQKMKWEQVQAGLVEAQKAGVRPSPSSSPNYVHAYTLTLKKRLDGRGIEVIGPVRSLVSGKNAFRCINGHEWKTTPKLVGEGAGCPECGIGTRQPIEIAKAVGAGVVCLLINTNKPGFIRIGGVIGGLSEVNTAYPWGEWEIHRLRNVDNVALAESLAWELLGATHLQSQTEIAISLDRAEEVFRNLIFVLREEIALDELRLNNCD